MYGHNCWDTKAQSSINKILYETLVMNDKDTSFRDECPSHNGYNNTLSLQINWGSTFQLIYTV